ncbi:MAG: dihydrodipicolinate synthase family protein [Proteobacteria bacterium]|nr:dihydrodipicolinate synthase family protein [Pseudomonadota bacterium]
MSNTKGSLGGVFPVVATPFRDDGAVDRDGLERVVEWLIGCGVDCVVFPGVASEFDQLTSAERDELVKFVGGLAKGRVAYIVGAGAATATEAAAYARQGEAAGAAAAMILAPSSLKGDEAALRRFYEEIAAKSSLAIMLQNAPAPVGAGFDMSIVARVAAEVPRIAYVKEEAMPCGQRISQLLAVAPPGLRGVFGGAGGRYILDELARGAVGTMPACELAEIHVALVKAWRAGDRATARALFNRSLPLLSFQAVFRMAMTKEVLRRRGLIASAHVRAPGPRLDPHDREELATMLAEIADLLPRLRLAPAA